MLLTGSISTDLPVETTESDMKTRLARRPSQPELHSEKQAIIDQSGMEMFICIPGIFLDLGDSTY